MIPPLPFTLDNGPHSTLIQFLWEKMKLFMKFLSCPFVLSVTCKGGVACDKSPNKIAT